MDRPSPLSVCECLCVQRERQRQRKSWCVCLCEGAVHRWQRDTHRGHRVLRPPPLLLPLFPLSLCLSICLSVYLSVPQAPRQERKGKGAILLRGRWPSVVSPPALPPFSQRVCPAHGVRKSHGRRVALCGLREEQGPPRSPLGRQATRSLRLLAVRQEASLRPRVRRRRRQRGGCGVFR